MTRDRRNERGILDILVTEESSWRSSRGNVRGGEVRMLVLSVVSAKVP